jgi:calcineurin-like phosphoesterase family protein
MKNTFFYSDPHFHHANVIKFDGRPFKNIDEMHTILIANYNSVVKDEDDVYCLGDFSFNPKKAEEILKQLKGNKFFIKGNHDHSEMISLYHQYGTYLGNYAEIKVGNNDYTLTHYPFEVWNKSHRGTYHIFGHCHHSLPVNPNIRRVDAGINGKGYNYTPQSEAQMQVRLQAIEWKPLDHHGAREIDKPKGVKK